MNVLNLTNNESFIRITLTKNDLLITDAKIYVRNLTTPNDIINSALSTAKLISQNIADNKINEISVNNKTVFKNFSKILLGEVFKKKNPPRKAGLIKYVS